MSKYEEKSDEEREREREKAFVFGAKLGAALHHCITHWWWVSPDRPITVVAAHGTRPAANFGTFCTAPGHTVIQFSCRSFQLCLHAEFERAFSPPLRVKGPRASVGPVVVVHFCQWTARPLSLSLSLSRVLICPCPLTVRVCRTLIAIVNWIVYVCLSVSLLILVCAGPWVNCVQAAAATGLDYAKSCYF